MGQSNSRCNCCNSNDKDEVKFEQKENGGNNSENPPLSNKVESVRDLKSYVTFKNSIEDNSNSYYNGEINFDDDNLKNKFKVKKNTQKFEKNKHLIILIQAIFKGYIYRKKVFPFEKITFEEEIVTKIKELYNKYLTPNLKSMETLLGTKINEESYKNLLINSHSNNSNIQFKEKRYFTKLLILKYEGVNSFYIGEVNINNELNGKGILINELGCKYDGSFEKNKFTGIGKYIDEEGNYYEGYFKDKKLEGKGIKKTLNGITFNCEFSNGIKEGKGREETSENIYEGEYKNDKKNGKGKLTYKNLKDFYEGDFKDNNITGKGHYEWANGESYKGTFLNGKMHGKGIYKWPDGGKYKGDYFNNIKEGHGIFYWSDGKIFDGPFKNGKPNGNGILTNKDKKFKVFFNDGKLEGRVEEFEMNDEENENEDSESKSNSYMFSNNDESSEIKSDNSNGINDNKNNEKDNNNDNNIFNRFPINNISNQKRKSAAYNENNYNFLEDNDIDNEIKKKRNTKK